MHDTDVFLIYPEIDSSSPWKMDTPLMPPLGLAFLAAILKKDGYRVKILDNSIEKKPVDELLEIVEKESPSLVGLSCLSVNFQRTIQIAKCIKEKIHIPIVVGGPHATVLPETLQLPFIDYICVREGEITLLELCRALRNGSSVENIRGLFHRIPGAWSFTGQRELLEDLDVLPHPARDLLPISKYRNKADETSAETVLSMNTSRGCPFDCTFCSVRSIWGRKRRTFSVKWILDDIGELITSYNANGIYFYEDNFTMSPGRVESICDGIIERNYNIKWVCEGRIGSLSLPLLRKMKNAGCETVKFGIESGSQRILDLIQKGITLEQVRETRNLCKKAKMNFACFFMLGIPSETDEDRNKTIKLIKELKPHYLVLSIFIPTPKSVLYETLIKTQSYKYMDQNYFLYLDEFDRHELERLKEEIISSWTRNCLNLSLRSSIALKKIAKKILRSLKASLRFVNEE